MLSTDTFKLDDLEEGDFSLDDITPNTTNAIKTSDSSNKQLSASTALLTSSDPNLAETIRGMDEEFTNEGTSSIQKKVHEDATEASMGGITESLVSVLQDETMSDDQKIEASNFALDKTSELFNLRKQVSTMALSSDNGAEENAEVERVRGNFGALIDEVNDAKRQKTALLNQRVAAVDSSTGKAVVDFFEQVIPFGRSQIVGDITKELKDRLPSDVNFEGSNVKSYMALGHAIEDIQDMLKNTPEEKRGEVTRLLADIVHEKSEILLPDTNDFAEVDLLRAFLEDGYYGDTEKWVDTAVNVLDITVLGGAAGRLIKGLAKGIKGSTRSMDDIIRDLQRQGFGSKTSPTSAGANLELHNPHMARKAYQKAAGDEDLSQSFYGGTKEDVVARNTMPDPINPSSNTNAQPAGMNRAFVDELSPHPEVAEFVEQDGKIFFTRAGKDQAEAAIKVDMESATGLHLKDNTFQMGRDNDDFISVDAVYAPNKDAGWETAAEALEGAKLGLRKYGVKDSDIQIQVRVGDEYVPLNSLEGEPPVGADYVARLSMRHEINPMDITSWADNDLNYNIFDRLISGVTLFGAPLPRYIKDAASLYGPRTVKAAFRAEDRAGAITSKLTDTILKGYDDKIRSLPKDSRTKVNEYLKEANRDSIKFDRVQLKGAGFNNEEIETLAAWKTAGDTMYILENNDMVKTLTGNNWQIMSKDDTYLLARPIKGEANASGIKKAYNAETHELEGVSKQQLKELYESGGEIAELKTPFKVGDEEVTHLVVKQNSGNYTRAIREDDYPLNYRNMHFTVRYKNPWFIDRVFKDKKGEVIRKETIANVGSREDAVATANRLDKTSEYTHIARGDRNASRNIEDDHIDTAISMGRSPQRVRGQRLRGATNTQGLDDAAVEDPMYSLVKSVRSMSNRVAYRDYLEAGKKEWIDTYGAEFGVTKNGRIQYPSKIEDIKEGDTRTKRAWQDARATWEYQNFLQQGYVNSLDDGVKYILRELAETLGRISPRAESFTRAVSDIPVSGLGKNVAFQAQLATSPARQFVVQGHQATLLNAIAPTYMVTKSATHLAALMAHGMGSKKKAAQLWGISVDEMDEIAEQLKLSGVADSIDRHSLINGGLMGLVDRLTYGGTAGRAFGALATLPRKMGFDAGEWLNITAAWLVFRNRAIEAGQDMSKTSVQAEVGALARNFTGSMNRAGSFPYNENALALAFQYTQAPHKLVLGMTTNKITSPEFKRERAKVLAYSLLMFTLPPKFMYDVFGDALAEIEDEELRNAIVFGLEAYLLNKTLEAATGENPMMDYSGISPLDMYGMYDLITVISTEGLGNIAANTPAASLIFGNNPRISDAMRTAARYFNFYEDGVEEVDDFLTVMESFALVSSGYSNYMKASLAFESGKKIGSTGKSTDYTKLQSVLTAFGFNTQRETQGYLFSQASYFKGKKFEEDVNSWYKEMKRMLAREGVSTQDDQFKQRMLNMAILHFDKEPARFREILTKNLSRDAQTGDATVYKGVLRSMGIMNDEEYRGFIQQAPIDEKLRKQLIEQMDSVQQIIDEDK